MNRPLPPIKPRRLRPGARIGVIAPASPPVSDDAVQSGITYLESKGFRVKIGSSVTARRGYLAGTDPQRVSDLHGMFSDKEVEAVIAVRGGYGSSRLLPFINYELIQRNPKIFVGYSDLTALQCAIMKRTGLITFSGPMIAADFGSDIHCDTESFFWSLLMGEMQSLNLTFHDTEVSVLSIEREFTGPLVGGNLSILCSLIGTPYFPDLTGAVLALEEIGEAPYRIDRMLNQLKLNNVFEKVSGILIGQFTKCVEQNDRPSLTLEEVFNDYFSQASFPVIRGVPFGHERKKVTLPLGSVVRYEPGERVIGLAESPVV